MIIKTKIPYTDLFVWKRIYNRPSGGFELQFQWIEIFLN